MRKISVIIAFLSGVVFFSAAARADDYTLTIKDKAFTPPVLTVPANQKVKLTIKNLDATTAEFESSDLGREKVVKAEDEITVYIGPLDPGNYTYFNDFNRDAVGTITAK